ncbi:hypothetical protein [Brevibacterium litoralis]|uniref:hypothetical protein n=1 Tax=Brevibacterium litoralis TaxID=3138935 RepID=UPI0032EB4883
MDADSGGAEDAEADTSAAGDGDGGEGTGGADTGSGTEDADGDGPDTVGLTPEMVMSAPIPSMCGFPEGDLVDGELPEPHPEYGDNARSPAIVKEHEIVAGDLTGDGVDELAAVFNCNNGGVSWPDQVVVFTATIEGIDHLGGAYDLAEDVDGARNGTRSIEFRDGGLLIRSAALLEGDAACCASGETRVFLEWDGSELTPGEIPSSGETGPATAEGIEGFWCPTPGSWQASGSTTNGCVEVTTSEVTYMVGTDQESTHPISFMNEVDGVFNYGADGAPFGSYHPAGVPIDADFSIYPAMPDGSTLEDHSDEDRIWNGQTGVMYLRG